MMIAMVIAIVALAAMFLCNRAAATAGSAWQRRVVAIATYAAPVAIVAVEVLRWNTIDAWLAVALSFLVGAGILRGGRYHEERDWARPDGRGIALAFPFQDAWMIVAGGPFAKRDHHWTACDQRFAWDFIRAEGESFGQPILAPATGTVVLASDGEEDHRYQRGETADMRTMPYGNLVVLQIADAYVFLAHLKKGSIVVRAGDSVRTGDMLGRCGDSGRSYAPHLHIHAQTLPYPAVGKADGIPIRFSLKDGRADVCKTASTESTHVERGT